MSFFSPQHPAPTATHTCPPIAAVYPFAHFLSAIALDSGVLAVWCAMIAPTTRCRQSLAVLAIACALMFSTWSPLGDASPLAGGTAAAAIIHLYQPDVASYCFADTRMQGAPLTCVAASYMTAADALAFGPAAPQLKVPAPAPVDPQPVYLSVVSSHGVFGGDVDGLDLNATVAVERSCRPDPIDGRVLCTQSEAPDMAAPWVQLVRVGADARPDGMYAMDAVVMRSVEGAEGFCGLVGNVVVCPAANATTFLAVF
nr:hypothetical protein [Pandoravirus massiliensis]